MSNKENEEKQSDVDSVVDLTNDEVSTIHGRYTNVVFTLNNYTEEELSTIKVVIIPKAKWVIIGKEKAPTTGTPHLQGYIKFETKKTLNVLRGYLPRAVFAKAKGTDEQNFNYCSKEGDWQEWGIRPKFVKNNGEREKLRWDEILDSCKRGKIEEIPPQIVVSSYNNIKKIEKDHLKMPPDLDACCGYWIQGPSGCGKSRSARISFPGAYFKTCNKWWDGYQGELYVILDDFDPTHAVLGHHLKIWADRYGFMAETKGSAMAIRPKKIIITSQYRIEDIWKDKETREALDRRFYVQDMFPPQMYPIFNPPIPVERLPPPGRAGTVLSQELFDAIDEVNEMAKAELALVNATQPSQPL